MNLLVEEGFAEFFNFKYNSLTAHKNIEELIIENFKKNISYLLREQTIRFYASTYGSFSKAIEMKYLDTPFSIIEEILNDTYLKRIFVYDLSAWTFYKIFEKNPREFSEIVQKNDVKKFWKEYKKRSRDLLKKFKEIQEAFSKILDRIEKEVKII